MDFSLQVAEHIINENIAKSESVVCSPASIDAILRILAAGAENSTLAQLLERLGYDNVQQVNEAASKLAEALKEVDDKDAPTISFVNGLWLDKRFSLKDEFQKVLGDAHNAQARVVDFGNCSDRVVEEANTWAEKETNGLIKQVISRNNISKDTSMLLANALYFKGTWQSNISKDTSMLLANALYFKGTWQSSFDSKETKSNVFNLLDGHKVRVRFMNLFHKQFNYGTFKECQILRMPYKSGLSRNYSNARKKTFSMYIFLPYEKDGLPNLIEEIKIGENLFKDKVKLNTVTITKFSVPKFKFESHVSPIKTLKQLGLTLPFEENCQDFSGIIGVPEPVYVSNIVQKCFIETNEIGTKAAAVTTARSGTGGGNPFGPRPPEIIFLADHPFMFMIREDVSGAILFVGTVLNPK